MAQIIVTEIDTRDGRRMQALIVDAPALTGTDKQVDAATGIRAKLLNAFADTAWLVRKMEPAAIEAAMNAQASRFAAVTTKQWLDANTAAAGTLGTTWMTAMLKAIS